MGFPELTSPSCEAETSCWLKVILFHMQCQCHPALAFIFQGMLQAMQLVVIKAPRYFLGPRAEEVSRRSTDAHCTTHQKDCDLVPISSIAWMGF